MLCFVWFVSVWVLCINIAWFCRINQMAISSLSMKTSYVNLQHWWPVERLQWLTQLPLPPPMPLSLLCLRPAPMSMQSLYWNFPPFRWLIPSSWFWRTEIHFHLRKIMSSQAKADHVSAAISKDLFPQIFTWLDGQGDQISYDDLKAYTCCVTSPSPLPTVLQGSTNLSTTTGGLARKFCVVRTLGPHSLTSR